MKIDNVKVYDLPESIVASGLPMLEKFDDGEFGRAEIAFRIFNNAATPHLKRAERLANNPANSGHCNFLKGIIVSANVSGTIKWWEQFQRYHFATIISSMSTMHRIEKMNFDECMSEKVLPGTKNYCKYLMAMRERGDIDFDTLIDNMPLGIILTARVQTNYLQLRTIWMQRHTHKYHEWKPFCDWIESLPRAGELIIPPSERGDD